MLKIHLDKHGFTLMEALMTVAIFGMMSLAIYEFYVVGICSWGVGTTRADLQAQTRTALEIMVGELKSASADATTIDTDTLEEVSRSISIPSAPGNTEITFYLPVRDVNGDVSIVDGEIEWPASPADDVDFIKYEYLSASNQLVRWEGGQQRIICNDVAGIEFSASGNKLYIILSLQKTTPRRNIAFTSQATLRLRN